MTFNPYLALMLFGALCSGFALLMIFLSIKLGPKHVTPTKELPWECGSVSVGSVTEQRFGVRFYLIAMLFILFDIEIVFMYPWAVAVEDLGWQGFFSMLTFICVLAIGLAYVWMRGILDWND
jgi:NADH-quinone oxidoreductase subunit A